MRPYGVVKGVKALQVAGGQSEVSFKYAVGDDVVIGVGGYNLESAIQDHKSHNPNNYNSAIILGKLYGGTAG